MATEEAKAYLASKAIPQLFESLMTGLMYYRPEDHVRYLQDCLDKLRAEGQDSNLNWSKFIEQRAKTPLPPIQPSSDVAASSSGAAYKRTWSPWRLEEARGSPLPPIGSSMSNGTSVNYSKVKVPDCPVVLLIGGPGSGRTNLNKRLMARYLGWEGISIGEALRAYADQRPDKKWILNIINQGDMVPEDVAMEVLKASIESLRGTPRGIIIDGFPRTMKQVQNYEQCVGRVDLAVVIDCEEEALRKRLERRSPRASRSDNDCGAVEKRMLTFKNETLPVIKHFDDAGKLIIIEGEDSTDDIFQNLTTVFDKKFFSRNVDSAASRDNRQIDDTDTQLSLSSPGHTPRPPSSSRPPTVPSSRPGSGLYSSRVGSRFSNVEKNISISIIDSGRSDDIGIKSSIIFISGGPGSGRSAVCQSVTEKFENMEHLSVSELLRLHPSLNEDDDDMDDDDNDVEDGEKKRKEPKQSDIRDALDSGDLVSDEIVVEMLLDAISQLSTDTKSLLISGFPKTKEQLELFNSKIGGLSMAIVLDCEEAFMKKGCLIESEDDSHEGMALGDSEEAVAKRIHLYKHRTLPVLGYLDSINKLKVVNIEAGRDEAVGAVADIIEEVLDAEYKAANLQPEPEKEDEAVTESADPSKSADPSDSADATQPAEYTAPTILLISAMSEIPDLSDLESEDTGRKNDLPSVPILSVIGGARQQVHEFCERLKEQYSALHIVEEDCNAENIRSRLSEEGFQEKLIILENYPSRQSQLVEFNETVGGMSKVLIVDASAEYVLSQSDDVESQKTFLEYYKDCTLPVLGDYFNAGKASIISGEGYDAYTDVCAAVDNVLEQFNSSTEESTQGPMPDQKNAGVVTLQSDHDAKAASPTLTANEETISIFKGDETSHHSIANEEHSPNQKSEHEIEMHEISPENIDKIPGGAMEDTGVLMEGKPLEGQPELEFSDTSAATVRPPSDDGRIEKEKMEDMPSNDEPIKDDVGLDGYLVQSSSMHEEGQAEKPEALSINEEQAGDRVHSSTAVEILEGKDGNEEVIKTSARPADLKDAKVVFVLGGPGSGKGTQCGKLVAKYGYAHLSTGDLLRAEVESGSDRGQQLTEIMEKGELVPIDTVLELLKDAMLKEAATSKGFLIDGYPRELDQAKKFESDIAEVNSVLYFDVSDDTMKTRLRKRAETSGRVDDNEETIVKRLETFHNHTTAVIDYYEQQDKVCKIVAEDAEDEIFEKVTSYLDQI